MPRQKPRRWPSHGLVQRLADCSLGLIAGLLHSVKLLKALQGFNTHDCDKSGEVQGLSYSLKRLNS